jgi:xanthine dehydrogenase accessory factor
MDNIYLSLLENQSNISSPVLATVVRTRGSAPQVPGSSALFDAKGLVAGTIGGGAVEKKIQEISAGRFRSGQSGFFHFNLANDISRKEDAICGGQITILVDANPMRHSAVFNQIRDSLSVKEPGILMTLIQNAKEKDAIVERFWATSPDALKLPQTIQRKAEKVVKEMLLTGDPAGYCEIDATQETGSPSYLFFESVYPPVRLVIAGAGHIGKALAHLGKLLGFEVIVIDDRSEYANPRNIPDASQIIADEVGMVMRGLQKNASTFIVIVTRGHKDDAEALKACIGGNPGYLGMIGSRKKIEAMREEFLRNGWATAEQWDAVHMPIGLKINARTVEEIAISIAAQLIEVKNKTKDKLKGCPT